MNPRSCIDDTSSSTRGQYSRCLHIQDVPGARVAPKIDPNCGPQCGGNTIGAREQTRNRGRNTTGGDGENEKDCHGSPISTFKPKLHIDMVRWGAHLNKHKSRRQIHIQRLEIRPHMRAVRGTTTQKFASVLPGRM